jgi:rhamnosyltransferase
MIGPSPVVEVPCSARVLVLMATYNGLRWLPAQLDSVLNQEGVTVTVVISDDRSDDGTVEYLRSRAAADPRMVVLDPVDRFGDAGSNFYHLLLTADLARADYVALVDQDDLWLPGKLAGQVAELRAGADGVSSNVTAFASDGRRTLVKKDYPQRRFDYLLETPGPGSTFLLSPRLAALVRAILTSLRPEGRMERHDWLIYGICRGRGWRWTIQGASTVDYRQHDSNAVGANVGWRSKVNRLGLIRRSWHREQAGLMADAALLAGGDSPQPGLSRVAELLRGRGPRARAELASRAGQLRRRPRDRWIIGVLVAVGVW